MINISIIPTKPLFPFIGSRLTTRDTPRKVKISTREDSISEAAFLVSDKSSGRISLPSAQFDNFPLYFPPCDLKAFITLIAPDQVDERKNVPPMFCYRVLPVEEQKHATLQHLAKSIHMYLPGGPK